MTQRDGDDVRADDVVYRWLPSLTNPSLVVIDQETGRIDRLASGAFGFHDDGCSVYLNSTLRDHALSPQDLVRDRATNAVTSLSVGQVRQHDAEVVRDPDPPDGVGGLADKAHALIVPPTDAGAKRKLRMSRALAGLAVVVVQPDPKHSTDG